MTNARHVLLRNNVNVIGSGEKVMLFAHGFGCDQNAWQFVTDSFTSDYKVVLFDYTGSGKSDIGQYNPIKYGTLNGYVQDVIDICEALSLTDVIFVGHSVSSMVGLLAANKCPEIFARLIFVGPSPRYLNAEDYNGGFEQTDLEGLFELMDSNYIGWSAAMAPAIIGNADRPELGKFLTDSFCSNDPEVARQFARVTFFSDNRADLPRATVKSLTLQCADDIIAPAEVGLYVKENTPGNTFMQLNATGHCPHISDPGETVTAIKHYLKFN